MIYPHDRSEFNSPWAGRLLAGLAVAGLIGFFYAAFTGRL